jgi:hypothetical protein
MEFVDAAQAQALCVEEYEILSRFFRFLYFVFGFILMRLQFL